MSFNAFVGGVRPGGLTNDFEVKILICFLLNSIEQEMTFDELNEIFQNTGLVNYFEFAESVSDLERTSHLRRQQTEDGREVLSITEVGRVTARTFEKTLPLSVREKTLEEARKLTQIHRCMDRVEINYHPVSDGYILELVLRDIGSDLLGMKGFLPTEEECLRVRQTIEDDPAALYSGLLELLLRP